MDRVGVALGIAAIWFGLVFIVDILNSGLTGLASVGALLAGILITIAGISSIVGLEVPEDTGDRLVPPNLSYYLIAVGLGMAAAIRTADWLGLINL